MKRLTTLLMALAVLGTPFFALPEVFAASASLSLTSARSAAKGATVTVSIYVNSDVGVNGAGATLSYPANLVDYVSIGSSSAFSVAASSSGGGGTVKVERGALSPVSGRQLLATVRFRAKVDSGTANIAIVSGNVYQDSADIVGAKTGTSFTLTPPAAAPAAPVADTTAPTITDVKTSDVAIKGATVTWKTSEPANSIVNYGFTKDYGIVAQDNNLVTEHKVQLNPAVLGAATEIHFQVKSADGAGNTGQSKDQTFTTKGLTLNVKVIDKDSKKPVNGALVKLENSKEVTTNKEGVAKVENLPDGTVQGAVTFKKKETFVSFTLQPLTDEKLAVQDATFSIDAPGTNFVLIAILALLLLVLIGVVWWASKNKFGDGSSGGIQQAFSNVVGALKNKLPFKKKDTTTETKSEIVDDSTINTSSSQSDADTNIIHPNQQ